MNGSYEEGDDQKKQVYIDKLGNFVFERAYTSYHTKNKRNPWPIPTKVNILRFQVIMDV